VVELDHEAGEKLEQKNNVIKIDAPWKKRLQRVKSGPNEGAIKSNRFNIQLILENDEHLKDVARLNTFTSQNEIYKSPKWRRKNDDNLWWTDTDDAQIRMYFATEYGISNNAGIEDGLKILFYNNAFHPVRDYIKSTKWDGKKRIESLFIDFLGAEDDIYSRTITRKMLIAAVARVFEPGVKFDNALILVGKQGTGKSYVLSRLGGEWFNESLNSFKGDEALMKLRGSWIIELAELSAMRTSEVEEVKGFISATVDTYREKFGRNPSRFPRQCVFFGSTNNYEFLKDKTGNRRFWPLSVDKDRRIKNPFEELTDDYISQLWAEAYQAYLDGEPLHLTDDEVIQKAEQLQNNHASDDGMAGEIEEYLNRNSKVAICAREIWFECLENDKQPKRHDITDINQIMRNLEGWKESREYFGKYGRQRGFIRTK
jgi:predicted P-loop ATPase